MSLKTRKPTGVPNWPMVLIEGPDSVGKSYQAAQFTGCNKTGQAYWLDVGEGAADEYINVPGADYLILDHDGSWQDILQQVREAATAAEGSDKPAVLVVDSMSNIWDMLKSWVNNRARNSKNGKRILAADPDAEIKPAPNLWNDANDRHHQFMNLLTRFPGIVILTAKGKETMAVDAEGRPVQGAKDYSVEANKNLPFRVNAHVRLSRDDPPMVVSFRSATNGLRPGVDRPQRYPDFTLEALIFDVMGLEKAQTRDVTELVTDEKHLADAARAELGEFLRANGIGYKAVAERFHESQGETLEDTRDPSAIRSLLQALRDEKAAS
ncbi:RecA-like DNA recombinase [Mycobacterium phage Renaud18]|uniref:RecA-like DNA recombinase n=1 Tax=Mycobacterium phage Renaud18 TaxID=2301701 RepID=A0A385DZR8_9CAUD|nr:DNA recombinase [Mycobacterium phage Renaud18]AXQ64981.1 RecA-like DNA recombinase [Mycobacterium phage Renaud18]